MEDHRHSSVRPRRFLLFVPALILLPVFGCVFSIGGSHEPPITVVDGAGRPLKQKGEVQLVESSTGIIDVYYPIVYATPPNLQLECSFPDNIELVDQQPDHFSIRSKFGGLFTVGWTAIGMPATSAPSAPLPPPPDPIPGPELIPAEQEEVIDPDTEDF